MEENSVAKILRTIGIVEAVCGVILFLVLMGDEDTIYLAVAIAITSFVTCVSFYGFAEIIALLQKSTYNQSLILSQLELTAGKKGEATDSVLRDIEKNLPKI